MEPIAILLRHTKCQSAGSAQEDWSSGGPFASREDCDGYRHVQGGENAKYWSCKSTADGWILEPKTTY